MITLWILYIFNKALYVIVCICVYSISPLSIQQWKYEKVYVAWPLDFPLYVLLIDAYNVLTYRNVFLHCLFCCSCYYGIFLLRLHRYTKNNLVFLKYTVIKSFICCWRKVEKLVMAQGWVRNNINNKLMWACINCKKHKSLCRRIWDKNQWYHIVFANGWFCSHPCCPPS